MSCCPLHFCNFSIVNTGYILLMYLLPTNVLSLLSSLFLQFHTLSRNTGHVILLSPTYSKCLAVLVGDEQSGRTPQSCSTDPMFDLMTLLFMLSDLACQKQKPASAAKWSLCQWLLLELQKSGKHNNSKGFPVRYNHIHQRKSGDQNCGDGA